MQRGREIAPRDYGGLEIEMENFLCLLLSWMKCHGINLGRMIYNVCNHSVS